MREIIVGTKNEAKVNQIRGALAGLDIKVLGIQDLEDKNLPDVEEDGQTAVENAQKKALSYSQALNHPVFSMDNALYFNDLPTDQQPGLHVRRISKINDRPSDEELIEHYSQLVEKLGGQKGETKGHWEFGICIALPNGYHQETTIISPRLFKSKVSSRIVKGYPLESIQVDPETGKYISEMSDEEQALFWQKAIGDRLVKFVQTATF